MGNGLSLLMYMEFGPLDMFVEGILCWWHTVNFNAFLQKISRQPSFTLVVSESYILETKFSTLFRVCYCTGVWTILSRTSNGCIMSQNIA